jgi:hypothetical protein
LIGYDQPKLPVCLETFHESTEKLVGALKSPVPLEAVPDDSAARIIGEDETCGVNTIEEPDVVLGTSVSPAGTNVCTAGPASLGFVVPGLTPEVDDSEVDGLPVSDGVGEPDGVPLPAGVAAPVGEALGVGDVLGVGNADGEGDVEGPGPVPTPVPVPAPGAVPVAVA